MKKTKIAKATFTQAVTILLAVLITVSSYATGDSPFVSLDNAASPVYETIQPEKTPAPDELSTETDSENAFTIIDSDIFSNYDPDATPTPKPTKKPKSMVVEGFENTYTVDSSLYEEYPVFKAIMKVAYKYVGYPYVWGKSNPEDGFDCSGLICYVYNQSGKYKFKRRGANGLYDMCEKIEKGDEQPGDIIFFQKTIKDSKGITHCGIYVGNGYMLHAGNPVQFEDITTEQWQSKMLRTATFGRLPLGEYKPDYK